MKGRKGLALAIMSKIPGPKGKESASEEKTEDSDDSVGIEAAARSVRKAIESGNDSALADALKDFIDIC